MPVESIGWRSRALANEHNCVPLCEGSTQDHDKKSEAEGYEQQAAPHRPDGHARMVSRRIVKGHSCNVAWRTVARGPEPW